MLPSLLASFFFLSQEPVAHIYFSLWILYSYQAMCTSLHTRSFIAIWNFYYRPGLRLCTLFYNWLLLISYIFTLSMVLEVIMRPHIYIQTHTDIYMCTHAHTHIYIHTDIFTHIHTHICTCMSLHIHIPTHVHIHA